MNTVTRYVLFFFISGAVTSLYCESFIKPKMASSNKLKEECGSQAGLILKQIPQLMHAMADVQTKSVDFLEDLLDGSSHGFCSTATRAQLENRRQKMADFNKKMSSWQAEIEEFTRELK